jgi:hypothetical protein
MEWSGIQWNQFHSILFNPSIFSFSLIWGVSNGIKLYIFNITLLPLFYFSLLFSNTLYLTSSSPHFIFLRLLLILTMSFIKTLLSIRHAQQAKRTTTKSQVTNTTTRGNNKTPKWLPATIPATHRPQKTEQQNKLTKHAIDRIPYPFKNILFYISCDEFLFKIYKWGANMSMRFFL